MNFYGQEQQIVLTCWFQTSSLLFRVRAALSPSVGSKEPSASIPRRVLSTGSDLIPLEGGLTAEKAEAERALEARRKAVAMNFMVNSDLVDRCVRKEGWCQKDCRTAE